MTNTFGPNSCKPMILDFLHRAEVPKDDGGPITFRWHWPRGTFSRRMSALEIATFIMPQMGYIIPLLWDHPRVQAEFRAMWLRMATWPREELDKLAGWIRPIIRTEEDDLIVLELYSREEQAVGPAYFVGAS